MTSRQPTPGYCGVYGCGRAASWVITHLAEVVTLDHGSAADEALAVGHPVAGVSIRSRRLERKSVEWACHLRDHVERMRNLAELQLDDIEVERYDPEHF